MIKLDRNKIERAIEQLLSGASKEICNLIDPVLSGEGVKENLKVGPVTLGSALIQAYFDSERPFDGELYQESKTALKKVIKETKHIQEQKYLAERRVAFSKFSEAKKPAPTKEHNNIDMPGRGR